MSHRHPTDELSYWDRAAMRWASSKFLDNGDGTLTYYRDGVPPPHHRWKQLDLFCCEKTTPEERPLV